MALMRGSVMRGVMRGGVMRGSVLIPPSEIVYSYGITVSNTSRLRAGINRVKAGSGDARILTVGDSTDAGTGSDTPGGNGLRTQSWPYQCAPLLATRHSITVMRDNVFGGIGKSLANYALYNTAITVGSATFAASNVGPGGPLWNHALTTGPLRFTPPATFDRARIFWKGNTTGRNISLVTDLGATTPTSLVGDSTFVYKVTEVVCPTGSSWIELKASTAATVEWIGIETYNAAGNKLFFSNCGWGGSTSGTAADGWTQTTGGGTRPLVSIPLIAPDCIIMNLNINDMFAATPIATWQANMQTMINAFLPTSDIIICTSNPLDPAKYGSEASQDPFFAGIAQLAANNNLPFVNVRSALGGSYAAASGSGYMSDSEHMLAAGYLAKANLIDDVIRVAMLAA